MRSLISLCLLLLSILGGSAQSARLTLRTLSLSANPMPGLYIPDGKTLVTLPFSEIEPSAPVRVDAQDSLPIYTTPVFPKDRTEPPYRVKLPGSASSVLLLGWCDADAKPHFLAIPDSFGTAKQNEWLVINSTDNDIALQIGAHAKPFPVNASSHQTMKVTAPLNTGAAVTIATRKGDVWKTFYSTYWPVFEDKRCLILVVQDGSKMRVRQIFDALPKRVEP